MKTNLVVTGLGKGVRKEEIRTFFRECGTIRFVRLIRNKHKSGKLFSPEEAIVEFAEVESLYLCAYVCMYVCMCTYMCIHACMHVCMHVHIYLYICMYG
jgi:hypothetical protein